MKKIMIMLITLLLLSGCANQSGNEKETVKGDVCDFLTHANWEGTDEQCTNTITFREDGGFSNSCACGEPVGDADLAEEYRYRASDRTVHLLDFEGNVLEEGKILFVDDMYLVIHIWDEIFVYKNSDADCPEADPSALAYTGTEELTKPFVSVLDYQDNLFTVSTYVYDGDSADSFEVYPLNVSENATFSDVSVTIESGNATSTVTKLTKSDVESGIEFFHSAYLDFNNQGEVVNVIFYGETTIMD